MQHLLKCVRLPGVIDRSGKGRTSIYDGVRNGTFPPPIRIGARASAWLDHELEAVIGAYAAGASDDEIRALVAQLVAARRDQFGPIGADQSPDRAILLRSPTGKFRSAEEEVSV